MMKIFIWIIGFLVLGAFCFSDDLKLGWNPNPEEENIVHYRVYKKDRGNTWILVSQTLSPQYTEYGVDYGWYEYYVTSYNIWGESSDSEKIKINHKKPSGKPN